MNSLKKTRFVVFFMFVNIFSIFTLAVFFAPVYFVILFQDGTCLSGFPTLFPQKIFADLTAEGISVIETSTLTEEGVMTVKTEVRSLVHSFDY